jgi:hypothetical protein
VWVYGYICEFLQGPGIDIDTSLIVFTEIHELLCVIVAVKDVLPQILLLLVAVALHQIYYSIRIINLTESTKAN